MIPSRKARPRLRTAFLAALTTALPAILSCSAVSQLLATPTPTATPTPLPTPTPTPVPLADRDLSEVVLRQSDLPDEFSEAARLEGAVEMDEIFPGSPAVHENLVNGYHVGFATDDYSRNVICNVFVYGDEASAREAYRAILSDSSGEALDAPDIGAESGGTQTVLTLGEQKIHATLVVWRYREAVAAVSLVSFRAEPTGDVLDYARLVQARLEGEE
jgi:hypothetical protein